jgi:hypothetical protein
MYGLVGLDSALERGGMAMDRSASARGRMILFTLKIDEDGVLIMFLSPVF